MEQKTLFRSRDSKLGGVCGGIAEYFEVDKSIVRIIFILAFLMGFLGFFAYLIMWLVLPLEK